MPKQAKTFKIRCVHCKQTFETSLKAARESAEGSGRVVIHCFFCGKPVLVELPREYIEPTVVVRGRQPDIE